MLNAAITCAKSTSATGQRCQQLYLDVADPADFSAAVAKALADAGWSEKDGAHFCPRHDPADVGETFEVTTRYTPIADTGWEVRVPPSPWAETGATWLLEIRRTPAPADEGAPVEPVSASDWAAQEAESFLAVWATDGHPVTRDLEVAVTRGGDTLYALTEPALRLLLDERGALRALAPGERDGEDPFYRPGGVYVSANGWWRFTCRVVVAGVAIGVEECLKDRQEPRFTKRNIWRSVRVAGCDYEVDPSTGEPLTPRNEE